MVTLSPEHLTRAQKASTFDSSLRRQFTTADSSLRTAASFCSKLATAYSFSFTSTVLPICADRVCASTDKAGWGKRKDGNGHGFGIAAHRSFLTYVATVVEVGIDDHGQITIPRVDVALDAGLVVHPEVTRVQFEGAAVFGTSIVRSGQITASNWAIQQSNFNNYPVARINEAPRQTNVYIIESNAPPAGVGDPGVPPMVAALANAISAATGKRVR